MATSNNSSPDSSSPQKINLSTTQQLAFVNKGTKLVLYGIFAQIASSLIAMLSFIPLFPQLAGFVALAGKLSILIGYVFSLFAPEKTDARKYMIGALVVIAMGGIITELASMILQYTSVDAGVRVFAILATIAFAMPLVSLIFYLYFLKSISDFTNQKDASDEAEKLAVMLMAITGAQFLIGIPLAMLAFTGLGVVSTIVGIVFLLATIYWTFLFIRFLDSLEFHDVSES